jgi:hypothetical protein
MLVLPGGRSQASRSVSAATTAIKATTVVSLTTTVVSHAPTAVGRTMPVGTDATYVGRRGHRRGDPRVVDRRGAGA